MFKKANRTGNIVVWLAATVIVICLVVFGAFITFNWVVDYGVFGLSLALMLLVSVGVAGHRLASDNMTGNWGGTAIGSLITLVGIVIALVFKPDHWVWADFGRAAGTTATILAVVGVMMLVTHFTEKN